MSEFRQDLASGDWVISSPERAKRPELLLKEKASRKASPKKKCPFEDLKKSGNWPPVLRISDSDNWRVAVIKNKYPALVHKGFCSAEFYRGPYRLKTAVGDHELLITRDHYKNFADLSPDEATEVLRVLRERYKTFRKDGCVIYASAFFNWGASAGASIFHPHYQILSLPIIPQRVKESLFGAQRYFKENKKCVRCVAIKYEEKEKKRVVENNSRAIAFVPFESKKPFEIRIFPKKHLPSFEETPAGNLRAVADVLQSVLRRAKERLNDPDFNFFIHSAPFDGGQKYNFHHWHIEVIPQITIGGGFELSTGVDINVVDPDKAASILK